MISPNKHRASDHEAIEARAAAWLAERDDGLSPVDQKAFADWRAEDVRHEAAVVRLEATWSALAQLSKFRPEARQHPDADLLAPPSENVVRFPWHPVLGLAAAMVVALTGFLYWRTQSKTAPIPAGEMVLESTRYVTNAGGYQRATLADGSMIELNENSAVALAFTAGERRVRLERGEAHFSVAKNKARPFIVEAGEIAVGAVGTAFNMKLVSPTVEVLVTEGVVSLRHVAMTQNSVMDPTRMVAGERAVVTVGPNGLIPRIERPTAAAIREALAWQNSGLVFRSTSLGGVVAEFNRRNAVQIQIADGELADEPIVGNFQADDIEAFVSQMANNKDVRVERPSPRLVILHRAH